MTQVLLKEETKPVKQAFGSPAGKYRLAPKITSMIPLHETYIEPFAGGAAVYFKKPPSEKEVLNDKDKEIAFAFRFLRDMTPEQFERLKRYNWIRSRELFERMRAFHPRDDVEHFRRFYYIKKASYGSKGEQSGMSTLHLGEPIGVDHLWKVHERLKKTSIHGGDALHLIKKYNSPTTFAYLDPPYPGKGEGVLGKEYGAFDEDDLARLVRVLQDFKGWFALSLGSEHAKLLPKSWHIKKVATKYPWKMRAGEKLATVYEIIATNYNPDIVKIQPRIIKSTIQEPLITKSSNSKNSNKMPKEVALAIGSYNAKVTPGGEVIVKAKRVYERIKEEEIYRCEC